VALQHLCGYLDLYQVQLVKAGPEPRETTDRSEGQVTKVVRGQRLADTGRSAQGGRGSWIPAVRPPETKKLQKSDEVQASSSGAERAGEGSPEDRSVQESPPSSGQALQAQAQGLDIVT